jgi:hypothetical protein
MGSSGQGRGWRLGLALVCAAALALRVGYVLVFRHPSEISGDPAQYHHGANLLVHGKGFIDAFTYQYFGIVRQTALHAPLYTVALAVPSALGLGSFLDHQLWSCLLGTGTVAVVGLVGRRLAGPRAGLLAAALAAVHPNVWIFDGLVAVETLSLLTAALTLLAAYRLWDRPSARTAAELGAACGLAALTRGEALLFLPLIVVPLVLARPHLAGRDRGRLIVVAGLAGAVVLGPWVVFNLARFDRPLLVSRFDVAMAPANCDAAYYGPGTGYWSSTCFPPLPPGGDESDDAVVYRRAAFAYMRTHLDRLPAVVLARVGRAFGLYRPLQQLGLDSYIEKRELAVARLGLGAYYALALASVPGAVVLRRRGVPLSPLVALVAAVTLAVGLTYGQTRYRASAELVPVLLAAVALDAALDRRRPRPAAPGSPGAVSPLPASLPAPGGPR